MIKIGDSLPKDIKLYLLHNSGIKVLKYDELFKGKKVVIFALPGAYTSVCSSKHVPDFISRYDELKKLNVDCVYCVSVNDPWVMKYWGEQLKCQDKVLLLADGDASFTKKIGMEQELEGCGVRSIRYCMYVEDGLIKLLNVEEKGPTSYKVSGPSTIIQQLKEFQSSA